MFPMCLALSEKTQQQEMRLESIDDDDGKEDIAREIADLLSRRRVHNENENGREWNKRATKRKVCQPSMHVIIRGLLR